MSKLSTEMTLGLLPGEEDTEHVGRIVSFLSGIYSTTSMSIHLRFHWMCAYAYYVLIFVFIYAF